MTHAMTTNPLLAPEGLPAFSRIRPEHVAPALETVLAANRAALEALLAATTPPTWDTLMRPLEELDDRLHRTWAPVAHLNAVMNAPALREVYNAWLPRVSDYETALAQDERLYRALAALATADGALDATQRKILDDALRDFRLAGVHLPPDEKARFRARTQELAELEARFEDNVLDATDAWTLHVEEETRLAGVPADACARFAERARREGRRSFVVTLDSPSYHAIVAHARDRALRRAVFEARATRASDLGPHAGRFDNGDIMRRILAGRAELAQLAGYPDYASYSLATKMAESPQQVQRFLEELIARVRPVALREYSELGAFARASLGLEVLEPWDVAYASERLREMRFALRQEELRPYFPLPRVLAGLFEVAARLYGLRFEERAGVDVWHPDVRYFEIFDAAGELRGGFYFDPYARPGKRGGAWMDDCLTRRRTAHGITLPVAHLVCNFPPPVGEMPSLLDHDELLTLFHEFGHCLHHLLTRVDYADAAGIHGVEWDAVELPSQFHEHFCWQRLTLDLASGHWRTGERLPETLFARLVAGRNFHAGLRLIRQLEFALFDLRLHLAGGAVDPLALWREVHGAVGVVPRPEWDRFPHSFSHVFAGPYAAGYYGYLWADVLAADAFTAFAERGVFDRDMGERFLRSILERGGSRPARELFREFRGRDATLDAFLRDHGLLEAA